MGFRDNLVGVLSKKIFFSSKKKLLLCTGGLVIVVSGLAWGISGRLGLDRFVASGLGPGPGDVVLWLVFEPGHGAGSRGRGLGWTVFWLGAWAWGLAILCPLARP